MEVTLNDSEISYVQCDDNLISADVHPIFRVFHLLQLLPQYLILRSVI